MNNRHVGAEWEHEAVGFLEDHGYKIVDTNYRCHIGEIDIIGQNEGFLAFIEVKYRKNIEYGSPFEAVTVKKQQTIRKVAHYYIGSKGLKNNHPCRFDVVGIIGNHIELLKDAF